MKDIIEPSEEKGSYLIDDITILIYTLNKIKEMESKEQINKWLDVCIECISGDYDKLEKIKKPLNAFLNQKEEEMWQEYNEKYFEKKVWSKWNTEIIKCKNKPFTLKAIQFVNTPQCIDNIHCFLGYPVFVEHEKAFAVLKIPSLDGFIEVTEGDYIIKGFNKEVSKCRKKMFDKIYERL